MTAASSQVFADALKLSRAERDDLVRQLLDSLEAPNPSDNDMTDAEFEKELLRRMAESDADPSLRIPWSQVQDMR